MKWVLPTSNNIMERDDLRVGYLPSGRQRAERRQTINHGLREFVAGNFLPRTSVIGARGGHRAMVGGNGVRRGTYEDDSLELVWSNEAILVAIEVLEGLSQAFALQALHELRELPVCREFVRRGKTRGNMNSYSLEHVSHSSCPGRASPSHCKMASIIESQLAYRGDVPLKIKRNGIGSNVRLEHFLELVVGNSTRVISVKRWQGQQSL